MGKEKEKINDEIIRQEWVEYRNSVTENKSKSQDDFEKYINLLASGGLVLSLTFFEKIVPLDKAVCKPFVIAGMFLMVVTLLSNLYSHHKSILDSDLTIKEIDEKQYDKIFKNINKRNKTINILNSVSIWALIIGILSLITFVTINIYNMDNSNQSNKPRPQQPPKPLTEEKRGRATPPPPRPSNNPKK
ncbi:hypothetical protein [Flavobacterium daejeonense]|uniref:hypothetical protein n=1 Tax=Flavobacterium daejeonense TaxID=350893 RepID=UPI00047BE022|nr:hypothetical protein [Flavobacterium daejeonense]